MFWDLSVLLGGLGLLLVGGDFLVRGATGLARRLGVPALVVGLTVVAFGTSTPELVVNLIAARSGQGDVGFGNVVGSNIANLALLLGLTALICPLAVQSIVVRREMPMMLLTVFVALVFAGDRVLAGRDMDRFDRGDGLVLLLIFGVYLYYLIGDAMQSRASLLRPDPGIVHSDMPMRGGTVVALIVGGLVMLMLGGRWTVEGATALARAAGMSEVAIALTIVAVGTSLPELVTSLSAAFRKEPDLAIGNLVGSNIYNLTFVLGLSAAITPMTVPTGGGTDLLILLGVSLVVLPLALTGGRISRIEGLCLIAAYSGYTGWVLMR